MPNTALQLEAAKHWFHLANAPLSDHTRLAQALVDSGKIGDDGTTVFPIDAHGARRFTDDLLGSGIPKPVSGVRLIAELLADRATFSTFGWREYGWTPNEPQGA